MANPAEQRVDRLEVALARLSEEVTLTVRAVRDLRVEMGEFKNEMAEFKEQMAESAARSERYMGEFKQQMAESWARSSREMDEFKEESRRERREFNQKLGQIAQSHGRLVEDIAAPSVPRVLRALLGLPESEELNTFTVRMRRAHPERPGSCVEVDALAAHGDVLLLVEVKSTLTPDVVTGFAARLPELKEFFPEYAGRAVIGAVASVFVPDSLVAQAERLGLLVLAAGDDLLSIQNSAGFVPRRF